MPLPSKDLFGAPGHQRLNLDDFIYTDHAAPPHSAGIAIIASVDIGWVNIWVLLFRHLPQFGRVENRPKISSL